MLNAMPASAGGPGNTAGESERCTRERQAVGNRECRDGSNQATRSFYQDEQCEDEQQVINAKQDMLSTPSAR